MLTKSALKAIKQYEKNTDPLDIAYGNVTEAEKDLHVGPHMALPLVGWAARMHGKLFLSLSCVLIRIANNCRVGTLGWIIPLNDRTEKTACGLLTSFGWDGRVWPVDAGWPDGTSEAKAIKSILTVTKLAGTLVFPPGEKGHRVLRVEVAKLSGEFPLSPHVPAGDYIAPTTTQEECFRGLIADPTVFLP